MCFLSMINYSNILRIKIKSVYVKDFLISTKVRLKRGEHLHGEEPISSEPTFNGLFIDKFLNNSDGFDKKLTNKTLVVIGKQILENLFTFFHENMCSSSGL